MNEKVTIYSSNTCPYCDMAKEYFKSQGIEYEEKNTSEKENRQKLVSMGIRSVPVIFYKDKHIVGFEPKMMEEFLKENGYGDVQGEKKVDSENNIENDSKNQEENNMKKYVCVVCGYVYDPAIGDEDNGIKPGTSFEALPEDWVCPACGVGKDQFEVEE